MGFKDQKDPGDDCVRFNLLGPTYMMDNGAAAMHDDAVPQVCRSIMLTPTIQVYLGGLVGFIAMRCVPQSEMWLHVAKFPPRVTRHFKANKLIFKKRTTPHLTLKFE